MEKIRQNVEAEGCWEVVVAGEDHSEDVMLEKSSGEAVWVDEREVWSRQREFQAQRHGGEGMLDMAKA